MSWTIILIDLEHFHFFDTRCRLSRRQAEKLASMWPSQQSASVAVACDRDTAQKIMNSDLPKAGTGRLTGEVEVAVDYANNQVVKRTMPIRELAVFCESLKEKLRSVCVRPV